MFQFYALRTEFVLISVRLMRMRSPQLYLAWACLMMLLGGCARTVTQTTVEEDGKWTRTVELRVAKNTLGGQTPRPEQTFLLPRSVFWDSKTLDTPNEVIWRGTRSARLGESFTDIQIMEADPEPMSLDPEAPPKPIKPRPVIAESRVTVQDRGDGTVEYLETVTWKGSLDSVLTTPQKEVMEALKPHLPENLQQDAPLRQIALDLQKGVFLAVFGPPEPILPLLLGHPGLAEERLKERLGESMVASIKRADPQISAAELRKIGRALMRQIESEDFLAGRTPEAAPSNSSMTLIGMTTRLDVPGDVVETNGKLNAATGQVYWALYPEAGMLGPVQLRAVFRLKPTR